MHKLSFIIPVFNEEELIADTLSKVTAFLKSKTYSWEILVVDDGSTDKTMEIVKNNKLKNINIFSLERNSGKGAALRRGVEEANADLIVFSDADLSVPLKFLDPLIESLEKNEVAIGTRRSKKSKIVVHQPFLRESMGRVFTKLTQFFTATKLSDYTCGFKGFQRKAAKKIFSKSLVDRWAYDAEILFLANKYGYRISEVPVEWYNREATKVSLKSAVFTSFKDLISIRLNNLSGKYER